MENIAGHTIERSLIGDGVIIDVGCRYFDFAIKLDVPNKVYCIDPDPEVFKIACPENFVFLNCAISFETGEGTYYRNGEMTCLTEIYQPLSHLYEPCKTLAMEDLYTITGDNVDILKLDCEGAEYIILGTEFEPIPKQISVEFHKHFVPEVHNDNIDKCMSNLLKHYDLVYAHETGMDNLFIRK